MENKVIAIVDGREVTEEHLAHLSQTIGPDRIQQFQGETGRSQLVQELINQELFYSYALENGLEKDEEYLREVEIVKANLLKSYAIRKFLADIKLEEQEVDDYYNKNTEQFVKPETVSAQHILVSTESKAKEVKAELDNGADFGEMAKKHSSCPSRDRGGDLGEFSKGQMVVEFEEAAFEMNIGDISEPVKTQFGYHLIKVNNKTEAEKQELADIREQLKEYLFTQKQNQAYFNQVAELKDKFRVNLPE